MDNTAARARTLFPRGLHQPERSFRFSRDALLLADFAASLALPPAACVADLGAGCGVVGLALLLQRPAYQVVGVERDPALAEAARLNAALLDLPGFSAITGDISLPPTITATRSALPSQPRSRQAPFDAVICNPPWLREGAGRVPPSPARRAALFGDDATFALFFTAAEKLLKNHGALALVCIPARLHDVLLSLPPRLRPVRLRFVHSKPGKPAVFFLLEARKNSRAVQTVLSPLFLED